MADSAERAAVPHVPMTDDDLDCVLGMIDAVVAKFGMNPKLEGLAGEIRSLRHNDGLEETT